MQGSGRRSGRQGGRLPGMNGWAAAAAQQLNSSSAGKPAWQAATPTCGASTSRQLCAQCHAMVLAGRWIWSAAATGGRCSSSVNDGQTTAVYRVAHCPAAAQPAAHQQAGSATVHPPPTAPTRRVGLHGGRSGGVPVAAQLLGNQLVHHIPRQHLRWVGEVRRWWSECQTSSALPNVTELRSKWQERQVRRQGGSPGGGQQLPCTVQSAEQGADLAEAPGGGVQRVLPQEAGRLQRAQAPLQRLQRWMLRVRGLRLQWQWWQWVGGAVYDYASMLHPRDCGGCRGRACKENVVAGA